MTERDCNAGFGQAGPFVVLFCICNEVSAIGVAIAGFTLGSQLLAQIGPHEPPQRGVGVVANEKAPEWDFTNPMPGDPQIDSEEVAIGVRAGVERAPARDAHDIRDPERFIAGSIDMFRAPLAAAPAFVPLLVGLGWIGEVRFLDQFFPDQPFNIGHEGGVAESATHECR